MKLKNAIIALLNLTWGFTQTFRGLLLYIIVYGLSIVTSRDISVDMYNGSLVVYHRFRFAVSLGFFMFVDGRDPITVVRHEYGHSIQSAVLGPLYLLTVGVVSPARSLWSVYMILVQKKSKSYVTQWYHSQFPEDWADRLGGVVR